MRNYCTVSDMSILPIPRYENETRIDTEWNRENVTPMGMLKLGEDINENH